MSVRRKPNGRWEVRKVLSGRRHGRTFDLKRDADAYDTWLERRKQLGEAAPPEADVTLSEFVEDYWRLYAIPNLAPKTRDAYKVVWGKHTSSRESERGGCASSSRRCSPGCAPTCRRRASRIRRS